MGDQDDIHVVCFESLVFGQKDTSPKSHEGAEGGVLKG
jgi:hypothetical protein